MLWTYGTKEVNSSRHVADCGGRIFLNNANGPSNHHTKFEAFLIYGSRVYEILEANGYPLDFGGRLNILMTKNTKPMEKNSKLHNILHGKNLMW